MASYSDAIFLLHYWHSGIQLYGNKWACYWGLYPYLSEIRL